MPSRIALLLLALLFCLPGVASAAEAWQWPLEGEVVTAYRNGSDPYAGGQHRGIDIAGASGAEVGAATAGTVRFAGVAGNSGLTVSVRTADGRYDTSYLHLSAASVREGQHVAGGQRVGAVGISGRRSATVPHLHFGVREAGDHHAYHDPMDFLPAPAPAPREAPRAAPVPVTVPRPVAVAPQRVRAPGGVRTVDPVLALRPFSVPAGRRVHVSDGQRVTRPALGPVGSPVPVRPLLPAARLGARAHGAPVAHGSAAASAPQAGPQGASALQVGPEPHGRVSPHPRAGGAPRSGPDVGWALACLGLLAAAACLGRPGGGGVRGAWRALDLRTLVRPLLGGR
jgi:murein DD-endopeptidase MepM/ murein hydrolase activator NlpD